jgi:hypothetical protein
MPLGQGGEERLEGPVAALARPRHLDELIGDAPEGRHHDRDRAGGERVADDARRDLDAVVVADRGAAELHDSHGDLQVVGWWSET